MTTQIDIDYPPIYEQVINFGNLQYSDIWVSYWASFVETLISYFSKNGFFLPQLTQTEINNLQTNSLVNGQMLYNITANAPQFWQSLPAPGTWRTFLFV